MKKLIAIISTLSLLLCAAASNAAPRKIGVQMYSLNRFTLEESLAKLKPLKIDAVECYSGQVISKKFPKAKTNYKLNAEERAYMKKLLADSGMKMVSYGVVTSRDPKEIEEIFKFVKEMGGERILTESAVYFLPVWEKMAEKYGIEVLIHHHTSADCPYWDTEYFKRHTAGFKHIKYNPDPGHWSRSNVDPVAALKSVDGRIGGIHFKDQVEFGNFKNQPAPFGKGALDVKGMLAELDRQGFDGYYIIEYEANWLNNIPEIAECAEYLRNN